jgi:acyl dehydratase
MSTPLVTTWRIGDRLDPLVIPPISRTTLALFAGASGDHNALHIDIDAAHAAGLDDVFAQGMLSMAQLGRLLTDHVNARRLRSFAVRFAAITPIHAQPTCYAEVVDVHDDLATLELRVALPDGTVTLTGQAIVETKENKQ